MVTESLMGSAFCPSWEAKTGVSSIQIETILSCMMLWDMIQIKKSSRAHDLNGSWSPITSSSEVAAKMANANQGFSASSTLAFAFKIWWLVHYMWQEWYRRRNESIKKSGYIIDMWPSPSNNFGSFQITWAVSVSPIRSGCNLIRVILHITILWDS